jgi:hypothetical protein
MALIDTVNLEELGSRETWFESLPWLDDFRKTNEPLLT